MAKVGKSAKKLTAIRQFDGRQAQIFVNTPGRMRREGGIRATLPSKKEW